MKAAVIQMNSGDDKQKNIAAAVRLVKKAAQQGARLIVLPEVFNYRGAGNLSRISEFIPGETSRPFLEIAKNAGVYILLGSFYERIRNSLKVFNTSLLIDNCGKVSARYRKIHLFRANVGGKSIKEGRSFKAGKKPVVGRVGEFRIGLSMCYDLRFGWLYRHYAKNGADILCVPSAFTRITGQAHWEVLLRARAIENLSYVLAPNQIGFDGRGVESYGHSMIIDPWGKVLVKAAANKEEIIYASLDKKAVDAARMKLPDFKN